MHLDAFLPGAFASLAAAASLVEAEPARRVTPELGFRKAGVHLANQVERPSVRRWVGRRGGADGRLIDADDFVDLGKPENLVVQTGRVFGLAEVLCNALQENVLDQRALARPAHSGDGGDHAQGKPNSDVLQVVPPGALDDQGLAVGSSSVRRDGDRKLAREIRPVSEVPFALTFAGDADAVIRPPCSPAPGPKSMR